MFGNKSIKKGYQDTIREQQHYLKELESIVGRVEQDLQRIKFLVRENKKELNAQKKEVSKM